MSETCETCRFWLKGEPQFIYGDCRRMPPQGRLAVDIKPASYGEKVMNVSITRFPHADWPNTHQDDWCGEHQPKDAPHPCPKCGELQDKWGMCPADRALADSQDDSRVSPAGCGG